jgi:polysaccharide biosynthesis protein VpsF
MNLPPLRRLPPDTVYIRGSVLPPDVPDSGLRRLAWWLLVAGVLLRMMLSPQALHAAGVPYDLPWGAFPAKIHPGTYLLFLAWGASLVSHGNPLSVMGAQWRQHPLPFNALLCMLGVFAWAVVRHGTAGQAFFIDTLITPGVAVLTVLLHAPARRRQLVQLIMLMLLANACLAISEVGMGQRLIPMFAGREGIVEEAHFRASAFIGHPLVNAKLVVMLMPAVAVMPWSLRTRIGAYGLLTLSLLAFGSRSALAAAGLYAMLAMMPMTMKLLRGQYSYTQITGGLVGLALAAAALAGVVATTRLGDRIIKSLTWDNSANVRLLAFDVLDQVRGQDLWFGLSVERLEGVAGRVGIDFRYEAIENFWINLLLLLGIIGFVLFLVGFGLLVWHMWRQSRTPLRVGMVMFLIVASGGNSFASKTPSLTILAVTLQCAAALPRRKPARAAITQRPHIPRFLAGARP